MGNRRRTSRSLPTIRAMAPMRRRLWWLVRWAGHTRVAVLNGGFAAWQQAGLPVSKQPACQTSAAASSPSHAPAEFVTTAEVAATAGGAASCSSGQRVLVDARAADRFAGQNETLDPVAGHIPGARNTRSCAISMRRGDSCPPRRCAPGGCETLRGQSPSNSHRNVRLRRDGVPQSAGARSRRADGRPAVCGIME